MGNASDSTVMKGGGDIYNDGYTRIYSLFL